MRVVLALLIALQLSVAIFLFWQSEYPSPSTRVSSSHEKIETPETYEGPIYHKQGTQSNPIVVKVAPAQKTEGEAAYEQYEHFDKPLAERRVALATVAMSAFTFLLTIFTALLWGSTERLVKKTDETTKAHERAYLICGGMFGVPRPITYKRSAAQVEHRPKASDFEGPWRMVIRNYGRTPGFIRQIEWGVCPKDKFIEDKSISQIIRDKLLAEWMENPVSVNEVFPPTDDDRFPYRYVERNVREVDTVFFGKISYEDIFHEPHHSTWAFWHRKDHSDTIGSSFAEDWS
jgi:hypothetical protein